MRHKHDERDLSHIRAFTRHIGACDYHRAVVAAVKQSVVGNISSAVEQRFDNGVSAVAYVQRFDLASDNGFYVLVAYRNSSKGYENVKHADRARRRLQLRQFVDKHLFEFRKNAVFEGNGFFFGCENFRFELFELVRNKTFAADKRLFALKTVRNFVEEGVGHLNIIAENSVIADFERTDTRGFTLFGFEVGKPLFAVVRMSRRLSNVSS